MKNEYNFTIEHYSATSINGLWTYIQTIDIPTRTEAPSVAKVNNKWYLFTDAYSFGIKTYWVNESDDLTNWGDSYRLENPSRDVMRHFTPIVLDDEVKKNAIKNLIIAQRKTSDIVVNNTMSRFMSNKDKNSLYGVELEWLANSNGVIEELIVRKNTIYYISKRSVTINKLNIDNLKDGDVIYFAVNTVSASVSLTIKGSIANRAPMPGGLDLNIGTSYGNSDVMVGFIAVEKWLKQYGGSDFFTQIANRPHYVKHMYPNGVADLGTIDNTFRNGFFSTIYVKNSIVLSTIASTNVG